MGRFIDITGAPIQSDFQEMPLDFMSKALDIQQKSKDAFDTAKDSILPTEGGLASTTLKTPDGKLISLAQYEKEKYDKSLEDVAKIAINNPMEASRKFQILQKQRNADPILKWAKEDLALKPTIISNEKIEDKSGVAVRSYRDKEGKVIPINIDDIISGKVSTPLEYYNSIGYNDFTTPTRNFIKDIKGIEGMTSSTIRPYLDEIAGIGSMIAQGKSTTKFDRQTMNNLQKGINTAVDYLLNSKSAASQSFKAINGIIDGNGNPLVDEATAKQLATKFVLEQADDFTYDNKSTTTDKSWSLPSKGGSGDGDGKPTTPPKVREAGTTPEQYIKDQYNRISATTKDQIKKDLTMKVINLMGDPSIDRNDKFLKEEYKKIAGADGNIDPDKLINYDLSRLNPYLASNSTLSQSMGELYTLQSDYATLKQVDDEATKIAIRNTGYDPNKVKEFDVLPNEFKALFDYSKQGLSTRNPSNIVIANDGTVYQTTRQDMGLTPEQIIKKKKDSGEKELFFIDKNLVKTANKYLSEKSNLTDSLDKFEKSKKEEADKLLKADLEKQSKVKYLDFNDSKDQTEFDGDVQSAIIVAMNTSADDAGNFTNWRTGEKQKLPVNVDFDKSKYRGHIKTPSGVYKTLFSVYNTEGKELGVYTLDKTPDMLASQYVQGSIDPTTGINYEDVFDDISTSFSEQSKDSSKPGSTLLDKDTRPVGYTKPILQNNKQVATMRIDNNNQRVYTLPPDIITAYNAVAPSLGKNLVSSKNTFDINDVTKIVTIALANQ